MDIPRRATAWLLSAFFIYTGIDHFLRPSWYEPLVFLPSPRFWVLLSGGLEILLGLATPFWPRPASAATAGFLVLVYSANLHMWVNQVPMNGRVYSRRWHLLRLGMQALLIILELWIGGWIARAHDTTSYR